MSDTKMPPRIWARKYKDRTWGIEVRHPPVDVEASRTLYHHDDKVQALVEALKTAEHRFLLIARDCFICRETATTGANWARQSIKQWEDEK